MTKEIEKRGIYRVGQTGADVKASIHLEPGHDAMTKVLLGIIPIVTTAPPIGQLNIGPGAGLDGEQLIVETLVTDIFTMTNKMRAIVTLEGGNKAKSFKAEGEAGAAGASILFRIFVVFRE